MNNNNKEEQIKLAKERSDRLTAAIDNFHREQTRVTLNEVIDALMDASVFFPVTAKLSDADMERLKNAPVDENGKPQFKTTEGATFIPAVMTNGDGELFIPVYTSRIQIPVNEIKKFSYLTLSFRNCCSIAVGHPKANKLIVNPFTKNFIVPAELAKQISRNAGKGIKSMTDPALSQAVEKDKPLSDKAEEFFKENPCVKKGYLCRVSQDGEESYLISADIIGEDAKAVFERLFNAVKDIPENGMRIYFSPCSQTEKKLAEAGIEPFYIAE